MPRGGRSLSQEELDADAGNRGHARRQKLFDALAGVATVAIYVVPLIIGLFYILVLTHKAYTGDWSGLESDMKSALVPIAAYFIGVMSKNGISPS